MSDAVERMEEWCEAIERDDMAAIWPADVRAVLSALAAARQEAEANRRDAERYRLCKERRLLPLRYVERAYELPNGGFVVYNIAVVGPTVLGYAETEDGAIDAAKAGEKG